MKIRVEGPLSSLPLYQLHGTKWWCTLVDYEFTIFIDDVPFVIFVPAGYRYDRSTIWWEAIINKDSLGCKGALIHDVLCFYHGVLWQVPGPDEPSCTPFRTFSRIEADRIFYEVMLADHVTPWKAWVAWKAVFVGKNW